MNALETTLRSARPMTDFDGNIIPGSLIVKKIMNRGEVDAVIFIAESSGNCSYRDTGKYTYRNFSVGYTSYAIKLVISRSARRAVQITVQDNNPCNYLTASDLWEGATFPPEYTFTVMGHEAPRYCYDGTFIRGFKAESAMAALEKARATDSRYKYGKVVTYHTSGEMEVLYPYPRPFGEDGVPF